MEKGNDINDLRTEFYDKLVDLYGDEYKWIDIQVTMSKERPKFENDITFRINTGMIERSGDWFLIKDDDIKGPTAENSGAMWDNSNSAEKINS